MGKSTGCGGGTMKILRGSIDLGIKEKDHGKLGAVCDLRHSTFPPEKSVKVTYYKVAL